MLLSFLLVISICIAMRHQNSSIEANKILKSWCVTLAIRSFYIIETSKELVIIQGVNQLMIHISTKWNIFYFLTHIITLLLLSFIINYKNTWHAANILINDVFVNLSVSDDTAWKTIHVQKFTCLWLFQGPTLTDTFFLWPHAHTVMKLN
jgi:hypothetical protein